MNLAWKLICFILLLLVAVMLSLMVGANWIPLGEVISALFIPDDLNFNHI